LAGKDENSGAGNSCVGHIPVLADKLAELIEIGPEAAVIDATVGYGGHSLIFGARLGRRGKLLCLDVDRIGIEKAKQRLGKLECEVILGRTNFSEIDRAARQAGIEKADLILADLGFCSGQLAESGRGLSFQQNQPLDMRLDDRLGRTAADIVNNYEKDELADLIYNYGQERASRRIASFIVEARRISPIKSTGQLAELICRAMGRPGRGGKYKIHPATRTFQALRIAVNDELNCLERLLEKTPVLLKTGGYAAVISFHSLEDRIVKHNFRKNADEGIYEIITKRPLTADKDEINRNPRARSAKLRISRKI
jgi:16S rRNA (cytosine1402-N4)-methyltransferase